MTYWLSLLKKSSHREAGRSLDDKWKSCVDKVKKAGTADNPHAVCTAQLGKPKKESKNDTPQKDVGVNTKFWFWGASVAPTVAPNTTPAKVEDARPTETDPDELARKLLIENPEISAATYFNLLKANGLQLVFKPIPVGGVETKVDTKPTTEADSGANNVAVLRESATFKMQTRFMEAKTQPGVGPTKFRVILLREGMGNTSDNFFYTRNALESAVPLFEGAKCYADHPDKLEKQIRPERSVRDVIGHFENIAMEDDTDGAGLLVGDVVLMDGESNDWARDRVRHAAEFNKKYPDKDFVAFSIHAGGSAAKVPIDAFIREYPLKDSQRAKIIEAKENGVQTIQVAENFDSAVSCDLVTQAGAGGKVVGMIESRRGQNA